MYFLTFIKSLCSLSGKLQVFVNPLAHLVRLKAIIQPLENILWATQVYYTSVF